MTSGRLTPSLPGRPDRHPHECERRVANRCKQPSAQSRKARNENDAKHVAKRFSSKLSIGTTPHRPGGGRNPARDTVDSAGDSI